VKKAFTTAPASGMASYSRVGTIATTTTRRAWRAIDVPSPPKSPLARECGLLNARLWNGKSGGRRRGGSSKTAPPDGRR